MKYLSDYVHSKGLKFGMYSSAGALTCAGLPASYDHEYIDAATFAEWGVDFLKYDYCFHPYTIPGHILYKRMGTALATCGRDILFSACSWGVEDSMVWIKETGAHMWRSTGDIGDSFGSVKALIKQELRHMQYNGKGCFNDLDMLIVGMNGEGNVGCGGCTEDEYKLHFAFWCLFGSPLMIGCDVRKIDDVSLNLLKNPDLLRIDQDPAYRQPFFLNPMEKNLDTLDKNPPDYYKDSPDIPILARYLSDGRIAIGIFNLTENDSNIYYGYFHLDSVGVPASSGKTLLIRDIFTGEKTKVQNGLATIPCPPHSCRIFIADVVDK